MNMDIRLVKMPDGVRINTKSYTPDIEITGPPIICLHGLTRNSRDFDPIISHLLKLGRKVYTFDMRGRGDSDYDINPLNYHPYTYANDVLILMRKLKIKKAVFIGTSMGGIITMVLSSLSKSKIAGSILNDIGPDISVSGLKRIQTYVGNNTEFANWDDAIEAVRNINNNAFKNKDDEFWLEFTKRVCKEKNGKIIFDYDPNIKINVLASEVLVPVNLWPLFLNLCHYPTAVIRGEDSDILTKETLLHIKELRPTVVTKTIENIGHAPILNENESLEAIENILFATQYS